MRFRWVTSVFGIPEMSSWDGKGGRAEERTAAGEYTVPQQIGDDLQQREGRTTRRSGLAGQPEL